MVYKIRSIQDLYNQRTEVLNRQRKILNKVSSLKRDMNYEEQCRYADLDDQFDKLTKEIQDRESKANSGPAIKPEPMDTNTEAHLGEAMIFPPGKLDLPRASYGGAEKRYWGEFLKKGYTLMSEEGRAHFDRVLEQRTNTLQADKDVAGGYLVAPIKFVNELIKDLADNVTIRQMSTNMVVPGYSEVRWPVLSDELDNTDWTSELKIGAQDDMTFEAIILRPHPCAKYVLVSNDLLFMNPTLVDNAVRGELNRAFAATENYAFLNGTGAGQPLGIFTVSDSGIGTDRQVTTGATSTNTTGDHILEVIGNLKSQYRRNSVFLAHRDFYTRCRKLKTGDGQYLLNPGLTSGQIDRLAGYPIVEDENCPNDFSASQVVACFGNFSYYYIVTSMSMTVAVLKELFAASNTTGYVGRLLVDGQPIRPNAFSMAKLAA